MASTRNKAKAQTPPKNKVSRNLSGKWAATVARATSVTSLGGYAKCASVGSHHPHGYVQKLARPGEEYVAMVGQNFEGSWYYIQVSRNECLETSHQPVMYPRHLAEELFEVWKRVVLDNAIPWDNAIVAESIRIITYNVQASDITLQLAGDDDSAKEIMRLNAMSKLSDAEARLLGLTHLKAKQKLIHNPVFHKDDKIMLKNLEDEAMYLNTDAMMLPLMVS